MLQQRRDIFAQHGWQGDVFYSRDTALQHSTAGEGIDRSCSRRDRLQGPGSWNI